MAFRAILAGFLLILGATIQSGAQILPPSENPFLPMPIPGFSLNPDIDSVDARPNVVASVIWEYLPRFSPDLRFGDASLIIYLRSLRIAAQFDATAPFHPTAVGIFTRLPRQEPPSGGDGHPLRSTNTAILHATYTLLQSIFPDLDPRWRLMMELTGLDANDTSLCTPEDTICSPASIGNAAGKGAFEGRRNDGFNLEGMEGRTYFPMPFSDYTGYQPANTAYELEDAGRWQPALMPQQEREGVYKIQQFVTPQWALTEPYAPETASITNFPPPTASDPRNKAEYEKQAAEVLSASAALTVEKKLTAEFFDNKGIIFGIPFVALEEAANGGEGLSQLDRLHAEFIESAAAHDAGIAVWRAKYKYDAVRPFSAIRRIYDGKKVSAYGGLQAGGNTVDDMPGEEWQPYMSTADHPEYPSATACFCAAVAEAWRDFFGTDTLNATSPTPPGSSGREPGITPSELVVLQWPTLTAYEEACAQSRVDGGTHFPFAVQQSMEQCKPLGKAVREWVGRLVDGSEPPRAPFKGAPLSDVPEIVGPSGRGRPGQSEKGGKSGRFGL